jgi:hypothetical protein
VVPVYRLAVELFVYLSGSVVRRGSHSPPNPKPTAALTREVPMEYRARDRSNMPCTTAPPATVRLCEQALPTHSRGEREEPAHCRTCLSASAMAVFALSYHTIIAPLS